LKLRYNSFSPDVKFCFAGLSRQARISELEGPEEWQQENVSGEKTFMSH